MSTSAHVTVVDYGRGNVLSVSRALEHCGAAVTLSNDPSTIAGADRLVLPGVGAFGDAMAALDELDLVDPLHIFADRERPFLGICLGMQILFETGDEFGRHAGLGLMPGQVARIADTGADGRPHKIPHIGWSALNPSAVYDWAGSVLDGVTPGACVYFVHSFAARPGDDTLCIADCDYDGQIITASVQRGCLVGCQFHPEKSGPVGLQILKNFVERL